LLVIGRQGAEHELELGSSAINFPELSFEQRQKTYMRAMALLAVGRSRFRSASLIDCAAMPRCKTGSPQRCVRLDESYSTPWLTALADAAR
jgi:hypothetical protein